MQILTLDAEGLKDLMEMPIGQVRFLKLDEREFVIVDRGAFEILAECAGKKVTNLTKTAP
jgi:hypothetical protein